ncbi:hypothetical protein PR048_007238 [Dryococelus australis]|uniref:TTF-type domain-containing protein n=1 Tax=Dryococelus australis TaxID=614101 RepID=A0ABQ9ID19_9NEOP|nr:hypothetical protein PR048_007238 [Dryococelus australis]
MINKRDPAHGQALAIACVKEGSFQPIDLRLPVKDGRKFRPEWYKTFTWLEYSPVNNKAYCFVCRAYYQPETKTKADDSFTLSGFSKWKKAVGVFEKRQKGSSHMSNNVKLASALCESLVFCGRQSIELRDYEKYADSKNKGTFLELMELRSKDSNLTKQFYVEGFYRAEKTDGETLANLLKNVLVSLKLDINNLRAQWYDGASNMTGPYKGVAARILEENPTAMHIHCSAHVLNLCIVACCTEAVRSLLDKFEATLSALQEISQTDPNRDGQANALLKHGRQCDLRSCEIFEGQHAFRTEGYLTQLFNHFTEVAEKCGFRSAELPRKGKIPAKIGGGSKAPFVIVQQFYKVTILNPVIDILEQEIEARLQENSLDVLNH